MGWVIGAAVLFAAALLWWFMRSERVDVSRLDDDRTRRAKDGFFVRGYNAGSRIRWKARVNGTWRSGTADVVGEETFVYTGATPTEVEVVGIAGEFPSPVSAPVPSSSSSDEDDDDSSFTGFPSAY